MLLTDSKVLDFKMDKKTAIYGFSPTVTGIFILHVIENDN